MLKGVIKVVGVCYVVNCLGILMEDVVVIGNCYDDLEMIEYVGMGVVMGNLLIELKMFVDWVICFNNENGVVYMVKELFRKQQCFGYFY